MRPDGLVYIVPAAGYYYDYLNCHHLYDNWTPAVIGNQTFDEGDPAIEGGMFAVWNDHAGNGISVKDVHHRVFPALQTIAAKCWTATDVTLPYAAYDSLRTALSEAPGVNELARLDSPFQLEKVTPESTLAVEEIGYDYAVEFTIKATEETRGTELFRSSSAVFYLSEPNTGKLAFERDGYLNTFNYSLEPGIEHKLRIEGDNHSTRLYVDGELRDNLTPQTLCALRDADRVRHTVERNSPYEPVVYAPTAKLYYQRTLVFPLHKAGSFKSTITNLSAKHLK